MSTSNKNPAKKNRTKIYPGLYAKALCLSQVTLRDSREIDFNSMGFRFFLYMLCRKCRKKMDLSAALWAIRYMQRENDCDLINYQNMHIAYCGDIERHVVYCYRFSDPSLFADGEEERDLLLRELQSFPPDHCECWTEEHGDGMTSPPQKIVNRFIEVADEIYETLVLKKQKGTNT